jgi:CopG family nickel-responsive transcriptional regulator
VHLDHGNCLEVIAVKGLANDVENLSTALKVNVGVKHLSLNVSGTV